MKRLALLSALLISSAVAQAASAATSPSFLDRQTNNVEMIYNVDPALQCFRSARDTAELRYGLEHCDIALRDPHMHFRAQTVLNRGIIRYAMGDRSGALRDFRLALDYNPTMGDAYLNQALVFAAERRPDEAFAAINQGIAMGSAKLHVAYYIRAGLEEDAGRTAQAYRDYRRALTIKPDYQPALREVERFRVVSRQAPAS
jgi:tetratricopeptide (TPR) repeat protein